MEKYIVVFGGCNWDLTYKQNTDGTIPDVATFESPGGKGANQAIACARAGLKVKMLGVVGDDENGLKIINNLKKH